MSRARAGAVPLSPLVRTAAVALLLGAVAVFHVWSRTRVLAAGYALGELQKEHVTLTSEHDRLRIEVETLRSPAALERIARTRLGMAPPAPGAVSAAGPRVAEAGEGGRKVDGAKPRPGPAEPSRLSRATPSPPARAGGEGRGERARHVASPKAVLVAGRTPPPLGR
jgi:cell division protein FtsL